MIFFREGRWGCGSLRRWRGAGARKSLEKALFDIRQSVRSPGEQVVLSRRQEGKLWPREGDQQMEVRVVFSGDGRCADMSVPSQRF